MATHKRLSLVSGNIEKGQALQKSLIELFKLANVTESGELEFSSVLNEMFMNPEVAQAYVGPLVDIYKAYERKVDAVIGYGAFGAVLASLVAREFQNLYKSQQHQVIALSFESIDVEKRQAKFAFGDCSKLLRNRRTLFVVPVLNPSVWPIIKVGADAITDSHNLGNVCGIGTIIEYGRRPPGIMIGCEVESLMNVQFSM